MATSVLGLKTFAASDPVDYNEINDNYNKIDSGVKTALQGRAAHNLLDNSNFQINQRGKTTYTSVSYGVDRWLTNMGGYMTVTVGDGKITLSKSNSAGDFKQILPYDMTGKTVTYALKTSEGITVGTCVVSSTSNLVQIGSLKAYLSVFASNGTTVFRIYFNDSSTVTLDLYWAALYEGSYTADTLPAYQPKGYAAELAECQRYYYAVENELFFAAWADTNYCLDYTVLLPQTMRAIPTVTFDKLQYIDESGYVSFTNSPYYTGRDRVAIRKTGLTRNKSYGLVMKFSASADL